MIESLIYWLRWLHIVAGGFVLLLGLMQIILPKGTSFHRRTGWTYLVLMWVTGLSAITISTIRITTDYSLSPIFLLIMGLFSIYMTTSGFMMSPSRNGQYKSMLLPWAGFCIALFLCIIAFWMMLKGIIMMGIVLLIFAGIQVMFSLTDYHFFVMRRQNVRYGAQTWQAHHISRMIGSYIAATTAFLVNAVKAGPDWVKWITPGIIGTCLIIYFNRRLSSRTT